MDYKILSQAVSSLYLEMSNESEAFSKQTGVGCVKTCGGVCCQNPDVMASPIEMLPLAIKIMEDKKENIYLGKLDSMNVTCTLLSQTQSSGGLCSVYEDRPVICRLFGFSKNKDKMGKNRISICKLISAENKVNLTLEEIDSAPSIVNWAENVRSLCPELSDLMPINAALKMILEKLVLIKRFS